MMAGYPVSSTISVASSSDLAKPPMGTARPMRFIASANASRSSAISIDRSLAPISSTPCFSRMPARWRSIATLRAVWPPMVGSSASGFSRSMTFSTHSAVIGSM